jgi:hypothetical protein
MSIKSTLVTSAAALAVAGGIAMAVPAAASGGAPTVAPAPSTASSPARAAIASSGSIRPASLTTAASTTPASTATTCTVDHDDRWPLYATGRPKRLDAGDPGGVYLWHDGDGWHLRVTHRNDHVRAYSGTIVTSGELRFQRVLDERGDRASVGPDHHTLHFVFTNFGHLDGVDFQTHCAPKLGVSVQGDAHTLPASRVNLGYSSTHPAHVPFAIARVA